MHNSEDDHQKNKHGLWSQTFSSSTPKEKLMLFFPHPSVLHVILPPNSPEALFVGTEAIGQMFLS